MAFTRTPRGATHRDRAAAPPRVHRAAPERPPSLGRGLSRHHRLSRARYPSPRPISGSRLTSGAAGGWSYEKLGFGCPDTLAAEGELHEGCRWPSPPSPRPHRPPPGLLPRGGWSHPRGPGARSSFRLDDASPRALTDGSLPSSSLRRLPTGPARPLRRGPCCPLGPWLHLTRPSHVRLPRPSPSARAKFLEGRTRLRGPRHLHPADRGLGSARQTGLDRLFVHWETKSILSRHGKPALLCEQTVPPEELLVQHVPWTLTSRRSDFVQNQQDKTPTARSQGHRRRARGPALPTARPAPALPTPGTGAESLEKSFLHEYAVSPGPLESAGRRVLTQPSAPRYWREQGLGQTHHAATGGLLQASAYTETGSYDGPSSTAE